MIGYSTMVHTGSLTMRLSMVIPKGQPVGSSTRCVVQSARNASTWRCTSSTNARFARMSRVAGTAVPGCRSRAVTGSPVRYSDSWVSSTALGVNAK
jgi:hypothetical protein